MSSTFNGNSFAKDWLSQFNLYKYESTTPKKSKNIPKGIYFSFGMILLISLGVCLVIVNSSAEIKYEQKIVIEDKNASIEQTYQNVDENQLTTQIKEDLSTTSFTTQYSTANQPLRPPKSEPHSEEQSEFFNNNPITASLPVLNNETEYLLEREDSQPIKYRSARKKKVKYFQQPKEHNGFNDVTLSRIRDQIPRPPRSRGVFLNRRFSDDDYDQPRPFNFFVTGPPPSEFRKNKIPRNYNSDEVHSIQDILHQMRNTEKNIDTQGDGSAATSIQIAGRYKHLKGNGLTKIFRSIAKNRQQPLEQTRLSQQIYGDPFYPYKPQSPGEVNLLAMQQLRFARPQTLYKTTPQNLFYQDSSDSDSENMYQKLMTTNKRRRKKHYSSRKRSSNRQTKPLSLMLDIYPLAEEEQTTTTQRPPKRKQRPHLPIRQGQNPVNSMPYSFQLDNSYYNGINFPQIQHQKNPEANNFYQNTYLHSQYADNTGDDEEKPSQIMVHLNLFPKKKSRNLNRNGNYDIVAPGSNDRILQGNDAHFNYRSDNQNESVSRIDPSSPNGDGESNGEDSTVSQRDVNSVNLSRLVDDFPSNDDPTSINETSASEGVDPCCVVDPTDLLVPHAEPSAVESNDEPFTNYPTNNFRISSGDVMRFQYEDAFDNSSTIN